MFRPARLGRWLSITPQRASTRSRDVAISLLCSGSPPSSSFSSTTAATAALLRCSNYAGSSLIRGCSSTHTCIANGCAVVWQRRSASSSNGNGNGGTDSTTTTTGASPASTTATAPEGGAFSLRRSCERYAVGTELLEKATAPTTPLPAVANIFVMDGRKINRQVKDTIARLVVSLAEFQRAEQVKAEALAATQQQQQQRWGEDEDLVDPQVMRNPLVVVVKSKKSPREAGDLQQELEETLVLKGLSPATRVVVLDYQQSKKASRYLPAQSSSSVDVPAEAIAETAADPTTTTYSTTNSPDAPPADAEPAAPHTTGQPRQQEEREQHAWRDAWLPPPPPPPQTSAAEAEAAAGDADADEYEEVIVEEEVEVEEEEGEGPEGSPAAQEPPQEGNKTATATATATSGGGSEEEPAPHVTGGGWGENHSPLLHDEEKKATAAAAEVAAAAVVVEVDTRDGRVRVPAGLVEAATYYLGASTVHLSDRAVLDLPAVANVLVLDETADYTDSRAEALLSSLRDTATHFGFLLNYPDAFAPAEGRTISMDANAVKVAMLPKMFVFRTGLSAAVAREVRHAMAAAMNAIGGHERNTVCVLDAANSADENPLEAFNANSAAAVDATHDDGGKEVPPLPPHDREADDKRRRADDAAAAVAPGRDDGPSSTAPEVGDAPSASSSSAAAQTAGTAPAYHPAAEPSIYSRARDAQPAATTTSSSSTAGAVRGNENHREADAAAAPAELSPEELIHREVARVAKKMGLPPPPPPAAAPPQEEEQQSSFLSPPVMVVGSRTLFAPRFPSKRRYRAVKKGRHGGGDDDDGDAPRTCFDGEEVGKRKTAPTGGVYAAYRRRSAGWATEEDLKLLAAGHRSLLTHAQTPKNAATTTTTTTPPASKNSISRQKSKRRDTASAAPAREKSATRAAAAAAAAAPLKQRRATAADIQRVEKALRRLQKEKYDAVAKKIRESAAAEEKRRLRAAAQRVREEGQRQRRAAAAVKAKAKPTDSGKKAVAAAAAAAADGKQAVQPKAAAVGRTAADKGKEKEKKKKTSTTLRFTIKAPRNTAARRRRQLAVKRTGTKKKAKSPTAATNRRRAASLLDIPDVTISVLEMKEDVAILDGPLNIREKRRRARAARQQKLAERRRHKPSSPATGATTTALSLPPVVSRSESTLAKFPVPVIDAISYIRQCARSGPGERPRRGARAVDEFLLDHGDAMRALCENTLVYPRASSERCLQPYFPSYQGRHVEIRRLAATSTIVCASEVIRGGPSIRSPANVALTEWCIDTTIASVMAALTMAKFDNGDMQDVLKHNRKFRGSHKRHIPVTVLVLRNPLFTTEECREQQLLLEQALQGQLHMSDARAFVVPRM